MAVKIQKAKKKKVAPKPATFSTTAAGHVASEELKTAVGVVTTDGGDGQISTETEEVGVVHGKGPFANVGVTAMHKFGEYNKSSIQVSLHVPCVVDEKEINDTFDYCYAWVEQKMTEKLDLIGQGTAAVE